ncbi:hypothetical protein ASPWEDRAFT_40351 [Aspergillus wentii DTO 134E9]|uniref:Uncharacterized protein n=1 Tax=Aspergillus wentii DTO 134E9 TaxID=1073089 RepID=A0A1L9RJP8_ASPWE|nr:uncharacterized protein ASPWEDRAFT_40351 [Aspergillus wentii DTO 134E9]OJJ35166.1 hypothetical protein ASPWEDRAFT_40351 [Aspergillus wentii DTO 134E9]
MSIAICQSINLTQIDLKVKDDILSTHHDKVGGRIRMTRSIICAMNLISSQLTRQLAMAFHNLIRIECQLRLRYFALVKNCVRDLSQTIPILPAAIGNTEPKKRDKAMSWNNRFAFSSFVYIGRFWFWNRFLCGVSKKQDQMKSGVGGTVARQIPKR